MTDRLNAASILPAGIAPAYRPEAHGVGIVHLGLGSFFKAHLAACTDAALAGRGGDWRILGVSLRSAGPAAQLAPQDGRYTLIERDRTGSRARVIGAVAGAICSAGDSTSVLSRMADPACRIVSLTVTEKAYGLNRAQGGCDPTHSAVAADLFSPTAPRGVLGLLTRALALRFDAGLPPFTVLCCDNLPGNGALLRGAVADFARRLSPTLAERILAEVAFPNTMVDRITPAPTEATRTEAQRLTGYSDAAAVETESFFQWVIEDHFPLGRPDWAAGGALFVADVAPFEAMKLRMLNGSHSMLAYAGFHAGLALVRDVMADPPLSRLVERHIRAAAATLPPVPGIDLRTYAADLMARFANPAIAHETFQIAMDGTEKLPQRIFAPALSALENGLDLRSFAFATAAWMRHATGSHQDCPPYPLRDPRAAEISAVLDGLTDPSAIVSVLCALPDFMPARLAGHPDWRAMLVMQLAPMLREGMRAAILAEADSTLAGSRAPA